MNVIRYQPWSLLQRFQDDINRVLLDSHADAMGGLREGDESNVATSHWAPAVDIREDADRYVIEADVPGVDPKAIEITMDNGVLSIRGERRAESREAREGYRRVERARGTFYRRFSLPDSADPERITAEGRDGVLVVSIAKLEKVQPRRIEVQ